MDVFFDPSDAPTDIPVEPLPTTERQFAVVYDTRSHLCWRCEQVHTAQDEQLCAPCLIEIAWWVS